jgi:S1-C subfamily serine protease
MRSDRNYAYLLAVIALLILAVGYIFRPRKNTPAISQSDVLRLEQLAQKQNLRRLADYFHGFSAGPANHVVRITGADRSAVAWSAPGVYATASTGLPNARMRIVGPGVDQPASIAVFGPHVPVATFQAGGDSKTDAAPVAVTAPVEGDWVVAVARRADGELLVSPGLHSGLVLSPCGDTTYEQLVSNIPLSRESNGAGVFDLDGNLLGIVVDCGTRMAALTTKAITNALERAHSPIGRVLARYGWKLTAMWAAASTYFGAVAGMLVEEVWAGSPADRAGVVPGDVLVSAGGMPVSSETDAADLAKAPTGKPLPVVLLRFGREVKTEITPDIAPQASGKAGIVLRSDIEGLEIASVSPGTAAYAAGIRPGDRLLRIGRNTKPDSAALQKTLDDSSTPAFLVFQRGALRRGVFLTP